MSNGTGDTGTDFQVGKMSISPSTRIKIHKTQFFGAVCIVFLHSNRYKYFPETSDWMKLLIDWLGRWLPMTAMSIFFFLTGFLLFKDFGSGEDLPVSIIEWYREKIKKRFHGLMIPYLLWNTIWMIFIMIIGVIPAVTSRLDSLLLFDGRFISILQGIFVYKYNLVFWYIAAIILYSLLSPLFWQVLKNRYAGLLFLAAVAVLGVLSPKMVRPAAWFFNEMGDFGLFFFLLGAFFAIHAFTLINREYPVFAICTGLAVSLLCALILCLAERNGFYYEPVSFACKVCGACGFWVFSDVFRRNGDRWIFCDGFFLYAMHRYIEQASNKVFELFLPSGMPGAALINVFGGVVLTLGIAVLCERILSRLSPKIYSVLTGGRGNRRKA